MLSKFFPYFWKTVSLGIITGLLATSLLTWPFVTKLDSYYVDVGDYQFNGWLLHHNFKALQKFSLFNQKEYFQTDQFYPLPATLTYSDNLLVPGLLFSPIYALTGNLVFSVNSYVFLSYVLNFFAMYICLCILTKRRSASVVGGLVYAFNPLTFAHIHQGHIQLLGKYFLPFVLLSLYYYLWSPSFKKAFYFGLFFLMNSLTSIYFLLMSVVVLLFAIPIIVYLKFKEEKDAYLFRLIKTSVIFLLFLPIFWHFFAPYLDFSRLETVDRPKEIAYYYSSRMLDWWFANPESVAYGWLTRMYEPIRMSQEKAGMAFNYGEHTLFLNIVPTLLCVLGVRYAYKKYRSGEAGLKDKYLLLYLAVIFAVTFIFVWPFTVNFGMACYLFYGEYVLLRGFNS